MLAVPKFGGLAASGGSAKRPDGPQSGKVLGALTPPNLCSALGGYASRS